MWLLYSGDEKMPVYFHGANLSRASNILAARLGAPLLGTDMTVAHEIPCTHLT
jgi:hypothetical protein